MGGLMLVAVRGLAIAKWIHNAGGFVLLIVLAVSLLNLNLLGKMGFGAFCGFDGSAIFSGECRDPDVARTIRRSVWLAGPIIALFYILGTACVLVFTSPSGRETA